MKKMNKKILIIFMALFLAINTTYANENSKELLQGSTQIEDKIEANKTNSQEKVSTYNDARSIEEVRTTVVEKTAKKKKKKDKNKNELLTNDIHSIFTVEDCIKIAIENNPQIRSSVYNALMYKSKIAQAWANYFPSLGAGIQVARIGEKSSYIKHTNTLGYLPTLSGDMLLFDFGKTKANADMAKRTYEAKSYYTQENINTLIYKVKAAYYNILFAQAQVKVYEDTVVDYELQLKRAESFYNIGKKAKIDVITAEYNLGKARLNLVKAKNVLDVANAELSRVMGIPEYTNYELASKLETLKYDIEQENAIKKAFEVRPELISAKKTADAAKMGLRAKRRELAPNLNAFASYNNGLGSEYDMYNYQVGLGLNYSAFNLVRVKKQIDEASLGYKKSIADYEDVKHTVYLNVKKAFLDLKTAEEAIVIAKLALDEAKEQYRQVNGRYNAGVGDIIELKDGETTYLNARLDFYNALLNYNTTAANLEKEIGIPLTTLNESVLNDNEKN